MKLLQKNKGFLIIIAVFILVIFIYKNFFQAPGAGLAGEEIPTVNVGSDVLELNNSLESVTLDQSVFATRAYRNLIDFSTEVMEQPKGRRNPFGLIGVE
ncbi:MAG: hypothetical protein AB200_02940 [Parcubacteria bacterium C7867-005]|nr:MAG: hypothetical protein AB200_02940 [Parcubacteria bacterium C7867-005]